MEKTPLKFVWYYVKKIKVFFIISFLVTFCSLFFGRFALFYYSKVLNLANAPLDDSFWQTISFFILLAGLLSIGESILKRIPMFLSAKYVPAVKTYVIKDAFDYVNKHSIAFFNREMSGNISMKVQQLSNGLQSMFYTMLDAVIFGFSSIITAVVFLSAINSYFLLSVFIWSICAVILGYFWSKKLVTLSKNSGSAESKANGVITDCFSNYSEIKSFANYKFERTNLLKYLSKARHAADKEYIGLASRQLIISLFMNISTLIFALVSFGVFYKGLISPLEFIFALTLFESIASLIGLIIYGFSGFFRSYGSLKSALDTLAVDPEITDKKNAKILQVDRAEISFDNVSFSYNPGQNLFQNLSIQIKPGEKVGLVGASGSGKSTFIKLILRYFDIKEGAVRINGVDIRKFTQDSLHQNIATIPQDISLFNRSLLENIKYGRPRATDEEVFAAAHKACADEFIKTFPDGYNTIVGERGVILSGGERQRIAIARAILKNAPILIFDEATAALDSQSEQQIQISLNNLMQNKTVIAIAHRLSTLREMDRILVFDKGKIVEEGSHLSLLRKKGLYYKYYNMQANGFFGDVPLCREPEKTL